MEFLEAYDIATGILRPLFPYLVLATTGYFARRFVMAWERRSEAQAELAELRSRVTALEDAQGITERDVMRLEAGQDFAARLLGTRITEAP